MIPLFDETLYKQQAFIDNIWVDVETCETVPVENPSNGRVLGSVPALRASEIDRAVGAAQRAFVQWRHQTAKERAALLRRWYRMIMEKMPLVHTVIRLLKHQI